MHPADKFIIATDGPFAIIRSCALCRHSDIVRKERNPGRGWGMREGNKQRGRLIQHITANHADMLTGMRYPYATEAQRSDAMSAARHHAKALQRIERCGKRWHFVHIDDVDGTAYLVQEFKR